MNNKIKLLHIITHLPIGGAQDNTLYTIELLNKKKYDISLCCNLNGELVGRAKKIKDIKLINIPFLSRDLNLINDTRAFFALYKIIKKENYDIIHTHSSKAGFLGRIVSKINKVPIIIHTVHGFPFNDFMNFFKKNFYILIEKSLANWTDVLITVSNLNKKKIIDLGISKKDKIYNIYSGIDLKIFDKKNDRRFKKELKLEDNEMLIGAVGRLSDQKDPITLISAFNLVIKEIPNAHLVFVGDGPLRNKITKMIKKLKLTSKVDLIGNRDNPWHVYHSLDLFVMSSIYEGLGRSITEALSCGVPVVCTAVEGVPEIVKNGETGFLVEPRDIEGLANSIIHSLRNLSDAKKIASEGRRFVHENFDVNKMVQEIDLVYQNHII